MNLADIIHGPWAITDEARATIQAVYQRHLQGEAPDLAAITAKLGQPLSNVRPESYDLEDGIATLHLTGVLGKRMNLFTAISGGTSTEIFRAQFRQAMESPDVRGIIIAADTPGGVVDGTQQTGDMVFNARGTKPIVTVAEGVLASAGFWIGSAADRLFLADETTLAGSIGVKGAHVDRSKADAAAGVVVTELVAGKYKGVGSPNRPLSDDDRAILEGRLADIYTVFVDDVARNLGGTAAGVLATIAEGRVFVGRSAVEAGMAHGIATLDQVRERMIAGEFSKRGAAKPAAQGAKKLMDIKTLKAEHPELVAQIQAEARAEGEKIGEVAGRAAGMTAELERIKGVEAQTLPGHEALIATLKFDGRTTGPEAAIQILAAERAKTAGRLDALKSDADSAGKVPGTAAPDVTGSEASDESLEDKCKAAWEKDPKVKAEFPSLATYTAFERAKASGHLRMVARAQA